MSYSFGLSFVALSLLLSMTARAEDIDSAKCEWLFGDDKVWVDRRVSEASLLANRFETLERKLRAGKLTSGQERFSESAELDIDIEILPPERRSTKKYGPLLTRYSLVPTDTPRKVTLTIKSEAAFNGLIAMVATFESDPNRKSPLERFMKSARVGRVFVVIFGWPAATAVSLDRWTVKPRMNLKATIANWLRPEEWRSWKLEIDGDTASHWHLIDKSHLRARLLEANFLSQASLLERQVFQVNWIRETYDLDLRRFETHLGGEAEMFASLLVRMLGHRYEPFTREIHTVERYVRSGETISPRFVARAVAALKTLALHDYVWVGKEYHGDPTRRPAGWMPREQFEREFPPASVDERRALGEWRRFGDVCGVHESLGVAVETAESLF